MKRFFLSLTDRYSDQIDRYRAMYVLIFDCAAFIALIVRFFHLIFFKPSPVHIGIDIILVFFIWGLIYLIKNGRLNLSISFNLYLWGVGCNIAAFVNSIFLDSVYLEKYLSLIIFILFISSFLMIRKRGQGFILVATSLFLTIGNSYFLYKKGYSPFDIIIGNVVVIFGIVFGIFIQVFSGKFLKMYDEQKKINEVLREKRAIEKSLERSNNNYRILAETSLDFIFVIDRNDNVTYVNKAGLEVLQKGRLEVIGYPRSNFFPEPVNSTQREKLDEVFFTKKTIIADEKMKINDGFIYQNTHLIPIFDEDDEVEAVMGITRDVTHLREAEEKLIQAGKIKDEFIANISHEIRNPISVIGGFSEVMERTALSDEQKSYVGMIKSSSDYLLALVNDILDYSKVESGKLKTVENVFSLSNLIDSVKKSFYFQIIKKRGRIYLFYGLRRSRQRNRGFFENYAGIKQSCKQRDKIYRQGFCQVELQNRKRVVYKIFGNGYGNRHREK